LDPLCASFASLDSFLPALSRRGKIEKKGAQWMEERWWRTDGAVVYGAGSLASEGARSRACRRGCLSTDACSFDQARVCFRRKHMPTPEEEKSRGGKVQYRKRSKVCRVFCSANARERPARRRRAGRNRRRRRIIIKRTMPKPRFSPKMKHDSCHYQYVCRTNGNKCPVRVLVLRQLGRSASQAVSHATERLAASPLSARASGRQEASGASHA